MPVNSEGPTVVYFQVLVFVTMQAKETVLKGLIPNYSKLLLVKPSIHFHPSIIFVAESELLRLSPHFVAKVGLRDCL